VAASVKGVGAERESTLSLTVFFIRLWSTVRVVSVHQIHRLELLTQLSWLTRFIRHFDVNLRWRVADRETSSLKMAYFDAHSRLRSDLEGLFFADRQAIYNRVQGERVLEEIDPDEGQDKDNGEEDDHDIVSMNPESSAEVATQEVFNP
jgi:hypothetical protein